MGWVCLGGVCGLVVFFMGRSKRGVVGDEDMGRILVNVRRGGGRSLGERGKRMEMIEEGMGEIGEIKIYWNVRG